MQDKKLDLGTSFQDIQSSVSSLGDRAEEYSKSKLYEVLCVNAHVRVLIIYVRQKH